ncbi:MAG: TRAP transporter substrate-binding protein [Treponema sp.]|nr:TRAP transporter substrate-binding protein [Treponema sp.]
MKKVLAGALAVLAAGMFVTGCKEKAKDGAAPEAKKEAPAKAMVFRYAENQPQDYPTTKAAYDFAKMVEEKTEGRIKIEVYYGGQLGDEKSVIEQLQFGAIDFTRVSLSPLAEFSKSLNVLQLPYLYKDADQMWKVLDGEIGEQFLASVKDSGLIGLSWFDAGARNFYNSKKPVNTLEDLAGMKILVQESQQMMDMVQALGANPTPMAYGEVYSSLQTGVIDGAENNWPSYESTSHYEVSKYYVLDEHTRVPEMQLISGQTWAKLSDADKQIIKDAAIASAKNEREYWAQREKDSEAKVTAGGAVITTLTPEEKQKFQDAMAPLYQKYGAGFEDTIARIQATK